jgi:hypothetical protein
MSQILFYMQNPKFLKDIKYKGDYLWKGASVGWGRVQEGDGWLI